MAYNYYNSNQPMINQLMRYKDSIDTMINQMNTTPQPPVQNIINTNMGTEFEARILKDDEEAENILINKKTMFLDRKNKKVLIKELDGTISEEYEIVIPLDEKDKKILELEQKLKEMEGRINEHAEFIRTDDVIKQSNANDDGNVKSTTKTSSKSIQATTE